MTSLLGKGGMYAAEMRELSLTLGGGVSGPLPTNTSIVSLQDSFGELQLGLINTRSQIL